MECGEETNVLFPRPAASADTRSGCEVPNTDWVYTRTASQEINPRSASEQTSDRTEHLTVLKVLLSFFSTAGI